MRTANPVGTRSDATTGPVTCRTRVDLPPSIGYVYDESLSSKPALPFLADKRKYNRQHNVCVRSVPLLGTRPKFPGLGYTHTHVA